MERSDLKAKAIRVWGLPLAPLTLPESVLEIERLIEAGQPSFVITANLHYARLTERHAELRAINEKAAFIVADGMPLVWGSRLKKTPLPQRVAGSDLIWKICELAATKKYRLFLMGGAPGVADQAAATLSARYPGLLIAGTFCPPFRAMSPEEEAALREQIRAAGAQILIVALSQPKGELWIARNFEKMDVPFSIQLGASLDFVAGKVRRAPRWVQRIGMEWAFRLSREPRRLFNRYLSDGAFLFRMLLGRTRQRASESN